MRRTAVPAFRLTVVMSPSWKLAAEPDSVGTSDERIEAVVGGLAAGRVSTRMLLYLSVNSTPVAMSVLAQPSGTVTVNLPELGVYGTNAWLSGMSPAGLTSRCAELVALVTVVAAEVLATGGAFTVPGADGWIELPEGGAGIDMTAGEDVLVVGAALEVLVVGAALEVLAMLVDVTAAGEELPHAATPISPARTAKTPDAVRRVDFTGAP